MGDILERVASGRNPMGFGLTLAASGDGLQTAWVGLAGVLIGGFITGGFSVGLERRREKVEIRRAARLIDADLMFAEASARTCVEKKKWWTKAVRLTTDGWEQHRGAIAAKLPFDNWVAVMVAVTALDHLQESRDQALKLEIAAMAADPNKAPMLEAAQRLGLDVMLPSPPIPDDDVEQIKPMFRDVIAGRAALAGLVRDG